MTTRATETPWWVRAGVALAAVAAVLHPPPATPGLPTGAPTRTFFDASPAALLLASLCVVGLFRWGGRLARVAARAPRVWIDAALFVGTVLLVRSVTRDAFGDLPVIGDEIAYDLQARRFAFGVAVPASSPLGEMERIRFLVDDGRSYPLFQPGWPALLATFWRVHAPALAPAVATGLLVASASRLADRLYGRLASLLTAALLLTSAFVLIVGSSFFAHAFAAALLLIALERLLAALDEGSTTAAIAAGVAAAWLFVTRMPIALVLAIAGVIAGVAHVRRSSRRRARPLAAFLLIAALGPLAQLAWNRATTGDPFELPQDRYFALTEANADCHRLGFGEDIGCAREHPDAVGPEGFGPARALEVTASRWSVLRTDAWGTPLPFVVAALFLLRGWDRRTAIVLAAALGPIVVYFGFYYHAVMFGARLYYELMGPVAIAIAAFIAAPFERGRRTHAVPRLCAAVAAGALAIVAFDEVHDDLPERFAKTGGGRHAKALMGHLDHHGVHHAIVYLENCMRPDYADTVLGLAIPNHQEPPAARDRWFVRDFGPEHDRQMVAAFPAWRHVRLTCGWQVQDLPPPSDRTIVSEAEAKFPPDEQRGAHTWLDGRPDASARALLRVVFREPEGFVRFRQSVPVEGSYELVTTFLRTPSGGRFALAVDGVRVGAFDARGPERLLVDVSPRRWLSRGTHVFELSSLEGPGTFHVGVDRLELRAR